MKAIYHTVSVLYGAFLVLEIFLDWPHSAGWFAAALWYGMYFMATKEIATLRLRRIEGLTREIELLGLLKDMIRTIVMKNQLILKYGNYQKAQKNRKR